MSAEGCLEEPRPDFAGLDALVPRVMKLGVTSSSAVSEPRTTAAATTDFARFLDGAAFGAYQTDCRRRGCWYVCVCVWGGGIAPNIKTKIITGCNVYTGIYLHVFSLGLTFAGLESLKPPVTSVPVANTAAVFIPSTARSATTDSAGFPERAALWTHHLIGRGDG